MSDMFDLSVLSTEELHDINRAIIDEIRHRRAQVSRQFRTGQMVQFNGKRGHVIGKITKVNRMTLKVTQTNSTHPVHWTVSPNLCQPYTAKAAA